MAVSTKEVRVGAVLGHPTDATLKAFFDALVYDIQVTRDAIVFLTQKMDGDFADVTNASTNYEATVSFVPENVAQRTKR